MKAKMVKPDAKTNTNLRNIKDFENELIQVELCRTRYTKNQYGILTHGTKSITINKWRIMNKSYNFLKKYLHSTLCKEDMIFLRQQALVRDLIYRWNFV